MSYTDILKVVPTIQAAALVGRNYQLVKKKKKKASDFLSAGVDTFVGTSFIAAESQFLK